MYNPKQVIIARILETAAFLMSARMVNGGPDKQRQWVKNVHTDMPVDG
jgi:hypothetical protein